MSTDEAIERFQEALVRREEDRERYRARLASSASLRDYLTIQFENQSSPRPTQATRGYEHMKKRG